MKTALTYIRYWAGYILLLLLLCVPLRADVLVEAEVPRSFRIDNLSEFPDYTFFFRYQMDGETSTQTVELPVEEGKVYTTKNGAEAILIARGGALPGDGLIANKTLAGKEVTTNLDIKGITTVLNITTLDEETFALMADSRITTYADGSTQEQSLVQGGIFHFTVPKTESRNLAIYILLPILTIVGLFLLQRARRAKMDKEPFGRIVNLKKHITLDPEPNERVASE